MKKTDTSIKKIESNQSALKAMMIEMQKTLMDLSSQMKSTERKPENLAPQPQSAQYANLSPEQRAIHEANPYKNPPWSADLQPNPHTPALYTQANKDTQNSSLQESLEKTIIISPTQEKKLHSPRNTPELQSASNPPGNMELDEINRKRSQQGSPTTPPITKKLNANAHIMNDMVRKLTYDQEEKREKIKRKETLLVHCQQRVQGSKTNNGPDTTYQVHSRGARRGGRRLSRKKEGAGPKYIKKINQTSHTK